MSSDPVAPTADALSRITGVRLRRLQALFVRHWALFFRSRGVELSSVQGGLLLLIRENPGQSQTAFARVLDVEAPSLAQSLAPLVQAGLVLRYRAENDARAMALHLSKAGEAVAATISSGQPEHEQRLLEALTPQERSTLLALLDKAIAGAEASVASAEKGQG
jgi:DNA-binding MarR family transcriptional regulator